MRAAPTCDVDHKGLLGMPPMLQGDSIAGPPGEAQVRPPGEAQGEIIAERSGGAPLPPPGVAGHGLPPPGVAGKAGHGLPPSFTKTLSVRAPSGVIEPLNSQGVARRRESRDTLPEILRPGMDIFGLQGRPWHSDPGLCGQLKSKNSLDVNREIILVDVAAPLGLRRGRRMGVFLSGRPDLLHRQTHTASARTPKINPCATPASMAWDGCMATKPRSNGGVVVVVVVVLEAMVLVDVALVVVVILDVLVVVLMVAVVLVVVVLAVVLVGVVARAVVVAEQIHCTWPSGPVSPPLSFKIWCNRPCPFR